VEVVYYFPLQAVFTFRLVKGGASTRSTTREYYEVEEQSAVTHSLTSNHSFSSIEQLDEVTHTLGWDTEYRQLKPGTFSSSFKTRESETWFLIEEQSSAHVEVQAPAPDGMYVLAVVEGDPAVVNGQTLSSNHIFVQPPVSDLRVILPAGIKVTQIGVAAEQFEESHLAVDPDLSVLSEGVKTIPTGPGMLASVRQTMREALLAPLSREASREEMVSGVLVDILTVASDHCYMPFDRSLHRASAQQSLDKAREYIEAHLGGTIRMECMCHYAGATLRTIERIFAREVGMSPQQYVKARRLNAVRRCLLRESEKQYLSITEVAESYGFVHLGRFSGDYRRYFGERPSETVKKSKSRDFSLPTPHLIMSNSG
jgi:AraC family ethanolamine operon transcriptional activator